MMTSVRHIAHFLMWAGFVAAAFVSTRNANQVEWAPYLLTGGVAAAGVVLLRRSRRVGTVEGKQPHETVEELAATLERILESLSGLRAERESIDVYQVRRRIDAELAVLLRDFAAERETISEARGLQLYAEVMSRFAAGERNINRAWSASADGYVDEVWGCIERAEALMSQAAEALRSG